MSEIEFTETPPAEVDEIPAELPVLPLKETVVLPDSMTPLAIGQERSIRLVDDVVGGERLLALVTVRDADIEAPGWDDLYETGTAAIVHKMIGVPDGTLRILVQGLQRILELADTEERLREVSKILNRELDVYELGTKIQSQVQSELEQGQREFFLRQQLKAIQEELGEGDPEQADANELRERLDGLELPKDVRKAADRELARLERLPAAAAEYGVIRTYLDWLATLPGGVTTP